MSTRSNGSAVRLDALTKGAETQTLGIAFFDLSRFNEWFSSEQAEAAIGFLQHVYELIVELEPHNCRVVKLMGGSGLVVLNLRRLKSRYLRCARSANRVARYPGRGFR